MLIEIIRQAETPPRWLDHYLVSRKERVASTYSRRLANTAQKVPVTISVHLIQESMAPK